MAGGILPEEQALALATKRAVQAAGGLEVCAAETGISTSQISRCCSPNDRDSLTIRDAATIEAISHDRPGHPHITRTLARQAGFLVVPMPLADGDAEGLMRSVLELASDLGDVSQEIAEAVRDHKVTPDEAQAALRELDELDEASAKLRLKLNLLAGDRK